MLALGAFVGSSVLATRWFRLETVPVAVGLALGLAWHWVGELWNKRPIVHAGGYTELNHLLLNLESTERWMNLGSWGRDLRKPYPEACRDLARRLGDAAHLTSEVLPLRPPFPNPHNPVATSTPHSGH